MKDKNGGHPWPPDQIAEAVGVSYKTNPFFYTTAGSRDYGLTIGGRDSKMISLTDLGRDLVYAPNPDVERAKKKEAFLSVEIFKKVLEHYDDSVLPEMKYLGNTLENKFSLAPEFHDDFAKLFRENCKFVGVTSAGVAEDRREFSDGDTTSISSSSIVIGEPVAGSNIKCFVIMPFTEKRGDRPEGYFNEVLTQLLGPAGAKAGFLVTTANRRGSDIIQSTIVKNLLDADLVVADLTDHNPNVLFELGLRMAVEKPVALVRAKGTGQIFDVDNLIRVYDYNPNLWPSTVDLDVDHICDHIAASWESRNVGMNYIKLLKGQQ